MFVEIGGDAGLRVRGGERVDGEVVDLRGREHGDFRTAHVEHGRCECLLRIRADADNGDRTRRLGGQRVGQPVRSVVDRMVVGHADGVDTGLLKRHEGLRRGAKVVDLRLLDATIGDRRLEVDHRHVGTAHDRPQRRQTVRCAEQVSHQSLEVDVPAEGQRHRRVRRRLGTGVRGGGGGRGRRREGRCGRFRSGLGVGTRGQPQPEQRGNRPDDHASPHTCAVVDTGIVPCPTPGSSTPSRARAGRAGTGARHHALGRVPEDTGSVWKGWSVTVRVWVN